MTYSIDFRKKVLEVRKRDALTIEQVARGFSVGKASVMLWIGRVEPIAKRNTCARKIDMEALAQDVTDHPDAYQQERAQKFGVRQSAIFYALKRLNLSYIVQPFLALINFVSGTMRQFPCTWHV